MGKIRWPGAVIGAFGAALLFATSAGAAVTAPVQVTGDSPFAIGCAGAGHDASGSVSEEGEVEPWVAVDPNAGPEPGEINAAGAWQQDRWSDGGSHGLVASASTDGGSTWGGENFGDFSRCPLAAHNNGNPDAGEPGKEYDRGSDPWVSWGAGHRLQQIALTVSQPDFGLGFNAAILASYSDDFGATWSHPQVIKQDQGGNVLDDKESITADPSSGYVYAIWDRLEAPNSHANLKATENAIGYRGPTWFASSSDNGTSWSPARMIYDPGEVNQTIANQIAIDPRDGTLIDVFLQINNFKNAHGSRGFSVLAMKSSDHGQTWSTPVVVSKLVDRTVTTPGDNRPLRTGDIAPDLAIDKRTGAIYVVWQDGGSGTVAIMESKSLDGGATWSTPQKVSDSPAGVAAFTPSVDVNDSGAVAVTFYDFRNDTPSTDTALTDYWIRTSTDGGATWTTQQVTTTSFDMTKAPIARGFFVGDYEGLDHSANDFKIFFVQTNNNGGNPTDVYGATATTT